MSTETTATEAFKSITDKRLALESLINIASSVNGQQLALNQVALAARPSQDFPAKSVKFFKKVEERLADTDTTGLIHKLEKVEQSIERAIGKILELAKVDVNQLRDEQLSNIDVETFTNFIDEFKRRTQNSLAIQYVLRKRGVAIAPFHLPIPQEAIGEQIEQLKQKEKKCVKQIRGEIQSIISDTQNMLLIGNLPEGMEAELVNVKKAMEVNIAHLDKGGSVTEIPNVFEIVVLETKTVAPVKAEEPLSQPDMSAKNTSTSDQKMEEKELPQKSFWWMLKTWLSSPWSTSWKSIKRKHGKR